MCCIQEAQLVGNVDPGSPADAAGVVKGDKIVEVNGTNIGIENHGQVVMYCPCTAHAPLYVCTAHCTALHCTSLHNALHCIALHCTALHCTALHCTALH